MLDSTEIQNLVSAAISDEAVMTASPTGALRDNRGKLPLSWVPLIIVEAIAGVLFRNSKSGGGKYPDHNWTKGANHSTPLDSLLRHAFKRAQGEKIDPDDGLPHSWKILCNAAFLVFYEKHFPELNNIPDMLPTKDVK